MSSPDSLKILTIGHSNHELDHFLNLLERHAVGAVADVRSMPFSRYSPHFNREALECALKQRGIRYVFLGQELGARSNDRSCYCDGRVVYARLARSEPFLRGIERVEKGAQSYRIALMCAEKDPLDCHRTILVAEELVKRGASVAHILASGDLETHGAALERLKRLHKMDGGDLFNSTADTCAEALARQEQKIAYVDESLRAQVAGAGQ